MPTIGALPSVSAPPCQQTGGDILEDIGKLAIPFALLLAKNGVEAVMSSSRSKAKGRSQRGGAKPKAAPKAKATPRKATTTAAAAKKTTTRAKSAVAASKKAAPLRKPRGRKQAGGTIDMQKSLGDLTSQIRSVLNMYST